jgi:hypothetical protein
MTAPASFAAAAIAICTGRSPAGWPVAKRIWPPARATSPMASARLLQSVDAPIGGNRVHAFDEIGIGPQATALDHEREHGVVVPVTGELDSEVELAFLVEEPVDVGEIVLSRGGDLSGDPSGFKSKG